MPATSPSPPIPSASLLGWKQRLEQKGVAFWEEDHGAQRSLLFKDPNGIVLEITAPASAAISAPPAKQAFDTVRRLAEAEMSGGASR